MSIVYPIPNFYEGPDASSPLLDITGVRAPLYVISSNIQLRNTNGEQVIAISTDTGMTENSDSYLVTQKVVKAAIGGATPSASPPVYVTGGNIDLKNTAGDTVGSISTDITLADNSDTTIATQKAVKAYIDTQAPLSGLTFTAPLARLLDNVSLKNDQAATITTVSTDEGLTGDSDTQIPTQHAVKYYIDSNTYIDLTAYVAPIYKDVNDVQLKNSLGAQVTSIDVDGTLLANLDTLIPTQKAVKTYVGSAITAGLAAQTSLSLIGADPFIRGTAAALRLYSSPNAYAFADSASVLVSPAGAGDKLILSGGLGGTVSIKTGNAVEATAFNVTPTTIAASLPMTIYSASNPQFVLYSGGQCSVGYAAGVMTLNSGTSINTAVTPVINVLNTEQATTTADGAVRVAGGMSVTKDLRVGGTIYGNISGSSVVSDIFTIDGLSPILRFREEPTPIDADLTFNTQQFTMSIGGVTVYEESTAYRAQYTPLIVSSTTATQLKVAYSPSVRLDCDVSSAGVATLTATGTSIETAAANKLIVNNTTGGSSTTGSIRTAGGISAASSLYVGTTISGGNLTVRYSPTVYTLISTGSTGSLSIAPGGPYCTISAIGRITASDSATGPGTGALQVSGGISAAASCWFNYGATIVQPLTLVTGAATNGIVCDASSNIQLSVPRWTYINAGGSLRSIAGGPSFVSYPSFPYAGFQFLNGISQTMYGFVELPAHSSSSITVMPYLHWYNDSATGNCVWDLEYYPMGSSGPVVLPYTPISVRVTSNPGAIVPCQTYVTFPQQVIGTVGDHATIYFKVSRIGGDAADTLNGTAYLASVGFAVTTDKVCGTALP